jgi:hypothetical protein
MPPRSPLLSPRKLPICRQITLGDSDSRPLGQRWARLPLPFSRREKYCLNEGMAFVDWSTAAPPAGHHVRCGADGDNHAPRCPSAAPSEVSDLQANIGGDSDSRPLGAGMSSSAHVALGPKNVAIQTSVSPQFAGQVGVRPILA